MASVEMEMEMAASLGGDTRTFSRTQSILLETMQLVESRKSLPVPNHLLDSKIYSKMSGNSVVQARPAAIHFSGFELGTLQTVILRLRNVSNDVQRMHILPPDTEYFDIKYTKNSRLVPGNAVECTVEFTPNEWRYYYDCIRVHCQGEENLMVPIHAYPVMGEDQFPKHITFPPVPVGHRRERIISLQCNAPIDFEFHLTYIQSNQAFNVEPMAGLVPAQGEVDIAVTFSPTEFSTAHMKLQLTTSQFNAKPVFCSVTGSSHPGLAKLAAEQTFPSVQNELLLDPRSITPVELARKKKKARSKESTLTPASKEMEKNGVRFPPNLDTPFAVSQVLIQQPGKRRIKEIRDTVLQKKGEMEASTRQMKEAMFEVAVRKDVYEERQNQLRWQSKVGDDQISLQQKHDILEARTAAWIEYKLDRGDPTPAKELLRTCTNCSFRRTLRDSTQIAQEGVKFDPYTNDLWASRHLRLSRFKQAARTIIIRKRADRRISCLRLMILCYSSRKSIHTNTSIESDEEDELDENVATSLQTDRVVSITFPTYVEPNFKDDMAVDALGVVPYKPTELKLPKKTPFFSLKVPQHYALMAYDYHDVHMASVTYVPPGLVRELRSGAEDEIIVIPPPALREPPPGEEPINEGDLQVEDITQTPTPPEPIVLRPPAALLKPIEYPSMHIFNPAPGLQVFQAPLPYSEIDPDFHLCPLPRYTSTDPGAHAVTQKTYLQQEDVIHGVMAWKKFPSPGLTSLAQTPTLTNVWTPRWNDPFVPDLLPETMPVLLSELRPEDRSIVSDEDEEDGGVRLTPMMVNAQFALIDYSAPPPTEEKPKHKDHDNFPYGSKLPATNIAASHHGPIPKAKRELELDYFIMKKYNRLGLKVKNRTEQLNKLKVDPNLVLK